MTWQVKASEDASGHGAAANEEAPVRRDAARKESLVGRDVVSGETDGEVEVPIAGEILYSLPADMRLLCRCCTSNCC